MAEDVYFWVAKDGDGTTELFSTLPRWNEQYQWWAGDSIDLTVDLNAVWDFNRLQNGECKKFKLVEVKDDTEE